MYVLDALYIIRWKTLFCRRTSLNETSCHTCVLSGQISHVFSPKKSLIQKVSPCLVQGFSIGWWYTLPKTDSLHLKIGHPKRTLVFQPSIFRCYVSFREGILDLNPNLRNSLKKLSVFESPKAGRRDRGRGGCFFSRGFLCTTEGTVLEKTPWKVMAGTWKIPSLEKGETSIHTTHFWGSSR